MHYIQAVIVFFLKCYIYVGGTQRKLCSLLRSLCFRAKQMRHDTAL